MAPALAAEPFARDTGVSASERPPNPSVNDHFSVTSLCPPASRTRISVPVDLGETRPGRLRAWRPRPPPRCKGMYRVANALKSVW